MLVTSPAPCLSVLNVTLPTRGEESLEIEMLFFKLLVQVFLVSG